MGVISAESVDTPVRGDHWGCADGTDDAGIPIQYRRTPADNQPQSPYECVDDQNHMFDTPAVHVDGSGHADGQSLQDVLHPAPPTPLQALGNTFSPITDALGSAAKAVTSPFGDMFDGS